MLLKHKSAIITGAGSGIGRASALLFASEGAAVTVVDIDQKRGDSVAREIRREGGTALSSTHDVSSARSAEQIVREHIARFGSLDILFNNAGIQVPGTVLTTSEELWDRTMDVNLKAIFLVSKAAIPLLAKRRGTIINMASVSALRAQSNWAAHVSSKAAVLALTKCMALDHGAEVRVNCLCPGLTLTPAVQTNNTKQQLQKYARSLPLQRIASPEEIARAALFLASPDSAFMTGAALVVDGGRSAG